MDTRKELLIKSAARLYSLGVDLEGARERTIASPAKSVSQLEYGCKYGLLM